MADVSRPTPAYLRERLRYDPETGKLFWRYYEPRGPLWNGRWAGQEAFTFRDAHGYLRGTLDGRPYRAARVIWAMVYGAWPTGQIDHEDHDRAHNRLANLRDKSHTANARNQSRHHDNTSGVTGVRWAAHAGRWRAEICAGGRRHLGYFDSLEEAAAVRRAAEREHGFHPNHGTVI